MSASTVLPRAPPLRHLPRSSSGSLPLTNPNFRVPFVKETPREDCHPACRRPAGHAFRPL